MQPYFIIETEDSSGLQLLAGISQHNRIGVIQGIDNTINWLIDYMQQHVQDEEQHLIPNFGTLYQLFQANNFEHLHLKLSFNTQNNPSQFNIFVETVPYLEAPERK